MNFVVPKLVRSGDDLLMPSDMCISIYILYIYMIIYIYIYIRAFLNRSRYGWTSRVPLTPFLACWLISLFWWTSTPSLTCTLLVDHIYMIASSSSCWTASIYSYRDRILRTVQFPLFDRKYWPHCHTATLPLSFVNVGHQSGKSLPVWPRKKQIEQ